jgi:aminocarboxymuconate-semialdehyde decarboxylase
VATAGIVDVHGHITPPELFARLPMPPSLADIDGMIDAKAAVGIAMTIVGSPVGVGTMMRVPGFVNEPQTPEVLKGFHDWLASTVAEHPSSLRAYAYCNPFLGTRVLEYTAQTVREGGFVGIITNSSVDGEYLDSPKCDEFFAMVDELDVPVLLHPPAEPVGGDRLADFRLVEALGRFNDVTTGLASLVWGGRLEQYPDLKVVAGMSGGAVALVAARLDRMLQPAHWAGPPLENKITQPPSSYLAKVYVDTTSHNPAVLAADVALMGAEHVLFGTDFPPASTPLEAALGVVRGLGLDGAAVDGVLGGNARALFKLPESQSSDS